MQIYTDWRSRGCICENGRMRVSRFGFFFALVAYGVRVA